MCVHLLDQSVFSAFLLDSRRGASPRSLPLTILVCFWLPAGKKSCVFLAMPPPLCSLLTHCFSCTFVHGFAFFILLFSSRLSLAPASLPLFAIHCLSLFIERQRQRHPLSPGPAATTFCTNDATYNSQPPKAENQ